MFFILSKTIDFLLLPLIWIILLMVYGFFCKNRSRAKKSFISSFVLLLFFSNGFIVNEALLLWEDRPVKIAELKTYETAIVLTGVTQYVEEFPDRVFFSKGADRLLHTVQLYKEGKIKNILISGGSGRIMGPSVPEAGQLKKVFLYCGVPEEDIILEDRSRNTTESSIYSKGVIDSLNLGSEFLLITSAFHMPRSLGCFKKAGIDVDPYPVDLYSHDRKFNFDLILPSGQALYKWNILIREMTGYVVYKVMGYS